MEPGRERALDSDSVVLRKYYTDYDALLSAEGVLKALSVISCVASAAVSLASPGCGVRWGAGGAALGGGVVLASLSVGAALSLPALAPTFWLYTDLVSSTVVGVLILVGGALSPALCGTQRALDYVQALLAIATGCLVMTSTYKTFTAATRLQTPRGVQTSRGLTELDV